MKPPSKKARSSLALVAALTVLAIPAAPATLLLVDFGSVEGSPAGWDTIVGDVAAAALTDWSGGGDNDVTLTTTDFTGQNNLGAPGSSITVDGIAIPLGAFRDYGWGSGGAGSESLIAIDNLDAGIYNVSVFEGRTTDANGQFGRIWAGLVGDDPGTQNTGNFAGGGSTLTLTVSAGDTLFYRHQEDDRGGTSGMIVTPIPEPSAAVLLSLAGLVMLRRFR